ncbi:unnamed protein product [Vitrella brassicaformis CCMP3155]|uniref:Uncharacterized protein n=1 Tax=Vitrella brassicaformis (strain CCMP3155) TaxID=1169540 RepID=A0A0G4GJN9_VITBC|nr:unnamed protein product [Vitrella brassicaformis CCMP3155]|eukprot:CEM30133.1 unnamed protein product [Vitrella brassicaformis CCMP3155]
MREGIQTSLFRGPCWFQGNRPTSSHEVALEFTGNVLPRHGFVCHRALETVEGATTVEVVDQDDWEPDPDDAEQPDPLVFEHLPPNAFSAATLLWIHTINGLAIARRLVTKMPAVKRIDLSQPYPTEEDAVGVLQAVGGERELERFEAKWVKGVGEGGLTWGDIADQLPTISKVDVTVEVPDDLGDGDAAGEFGIACVTEGSRSSPSGRGPATPSSGWAIALFHERVYVMSQELMRAAKMYNHVTPRDILVFIKHFLGLVREKRELTKFKDTEEQVDEMLVWLAEKDKDLAVLAAKKRRTGVFLFPFPLA